MGRFSCFQPIPRNSKSKKSRRHSIEAMHERVLQVNGLSRSSMESTIPINSVEAGDEKLQDGLSRPVDSAIPTTSVEPTTEKVNVKDLSQPSVDTIFPIISEEAMQEKVQINCPSPPLVDSTTPIIDEGYEAMQKVQVNGLSRPPADLMVPTSSNSLSISPGDAQTNSEIKNATRLAPLELACNSGDLNAISKSGEVNRIARLKKSKSTGSRVDDHRWIAYADDVSEDETESNCLCDCHDDQNGLQGYDDEHSVRINCRSLFSIGDTTHLQSDKDAHEIFDSPLSEECSGDSNSHNVLTATEISKSHSEPNIHPLKTLAKCVSNLRSCKNLHVLDTKQDVSSCELDSQARPAKADGCVKCKEAHVDDGYESCNCAGVARDWIMPVGNNKKLENTCEGESSIQCRDELPGIDFRIKRIEEWVNDLQHSDPLEKSNDLPESTDLASRETKYTAKLESPKATAGIEAATSYISALNANATSAQLANHGLVAIPFISAFTSLKVLNLSGNAIVRITAGALPRALHMLNLSKNNISSIEGLRELTRLRVLDLSYNRVVRIGHGLAYCSSLKELYLAGNKISEVEGLHRLLKLNLLDLRYNKISTAKCLGQLAANYGSLQAISLEANPAQKNVGDENLKKFLQSLLPRLAYFNRQSIKGGILKDTGERKIVKLGPSGHQFECSSRPDQKASRKGEPASGGRKLTTSHSRA